MRKKNKKTLKIKTYNYSDYNSKDGMLTSIWGPTLWHFLHTISFNYPISPTINDKSNYKKFMLNLINILPCKYCRINLKKNFKILPLNNKVFENRHNFSKYMYQLHDLINKMLGKKSNVTYCELRDRYENFRSRCSNSENKKNIKEIGCVNPYYGEKAKCVLSFIPAKSRCKTIKIDKKIIKKKFK